MSRRGRIVAHARTSCLVVPLLVAACRKDTTGGSSVPWQVTFLEGPKTSVLVGEDLGPIRVQVQDRDRDPVTTPGMSIQLALEPNADNSGVIEGALQAPVSGGVAAFD